MLVDGVGPGAERSGCSACKTYGQRHVREHECSTWKSREHRRHGVILAGKSDGGNNKVTEGGTTKNSAEIACLRGRSAVYLHSGSELLVEGSRSGHAHSRTEARRSVSWIDDVNGCI